MSSRYHSQTPNADVFVGRKSRRFLPASLLEDTGSRQTFVLDRAWKRMIVQGAGAADSEMVTKPKAG